MSHSSAELEAQFAGRRFENARPTIVTTVGLRFGNFLTTFEVTEETLSVSAASVTLFWTITCHLIWLSMFLRVSMTVHFHPGCTFLMALKEFLL